MMFYLLIFAACIQLSLQPNQTKCKECEVGIKEEVNVLPRNKCEFMEFTKHLSCRCNCSNGEEPTYLHYAPSSSANKTHIVCDYIQPIFGDCVEYNEGGGIIQPNYNQRCSEHICSPCDSPYMSTDSYLYPQCFKYGGLLIPSQVAEKGQGNRTCLENESKEHLYALIALIPMSFIFGILIGHCWGPLKTKCVSLFKENRENEDSAIVSPSEQNKLNVDLPSDEPIKSSCVDLSPDESNKLRNNDLPPCEPVNLSRIDLPPDDSNKSRIVDLAQDKPEEFLFDEGDMKCIEKHDMNDMNVSPACEKNPLLDDVIDIEN